MPRPPRLSLDELTRFLARCEDDQSDLVVALRDTILAEVPDVHEAIKFHAICYFKPDRPYGAIGGNVCMISVRRSAVGLGFIHGAFLPDPDRLLEGSGKAKRSVRISSLAEARRPALRALIRRAHAYESAAR